MRELRICNSPVQESDNEVSLYLLNDKFIHLQIAQFKPESIVIDFREVTGDVPEYGSELQELYKGKAVRFEGLSECTCPLETVKCLLPNTIQSGKITRYILRGLTVQQAYEGGLFDD